MWQSRCCGFVEFSQYRVNDWVACITVGTLGSDDPAKSSIAVVSRTLEVSGCNYIYWFVILTCKQMLNKVRDKKEREGGTERS